MNGARLDYTTVTEVPGNLVSQEALNMVQTRYAFAEKFCVGKRVLEVACGPGVGLGRLARHARLLVGGDYTMALLKRAMSHYGQRTPLVMLDAHCLPFRPKAFEVVILFEAIYFLSKPGQFLQSCRETLREGGFLIIATVNPEWAAFNPAPHSTNYPNARVLGALLQSHGFSSEIYAGFPTAESLRGRLASAAMRAAVRLKLMPKTMRGKELLKRLAYGRLAPFPAEVSFHSDACSHLVRLADLNDVGNFRVLYAVAQKVGP
jgi:SAM-dependent methyltransferase